MAMSSYRSWVLVFAGLLLLAGSPARAQTGNIDELLKSLRALIDEADQANTADPTFLDDLRNLANSYDNPYPVKIVFDDFKDGDYTSNPAWTVVAGTWRVDAKAGKLGGLRSTVYPQESGQQDLASSLIGTLLKSQGVSYAAITLPATIPNAFSMRIELASRDDGGRLDFGPYLGSGGNTAYRLTYMPDAAQSFALSRLTSTGLKTLASSTDQISLEDAKSHVIDWKRDKAGKMTVALDGKPIIETTETSIRKPFTGFQVINSAGTYWIRSIAINGAK